MKITDRLIFLTKFLLKNFFIACTLSFLLILFYGDVNIFTDRNSMINSFRQMLLILFTSLIALTIVISVFSYHITSTHSNVIEPVGKAIIKPAGKLLVNNERTAIHEAGHALLAFLFDFDCEVIMYKYPAYTSYNCNINIDLDLLHQAEHHQQLIQNSCLSTVMAFLFSMTDIHFSKLWKYILLMI